MISNNKQQSPQVTRALNELDARGYFEFFEEAEPLVSSGRLPDSPVSGVAAVYFADISSDVPGNWPPLSVAAKPPDDDEPAERLIGVRRSFTELFEGRIFSQAQEEFKPLAVTHARAYMQHSRMIGGFLVCENGQAGLFYSRQVAQEFSCKAHRIVGGVRYANYRDPATPSERAIAKIFPTNNSAAMRKIITVSLQSLVVDQLAADLSQQAAPAQPVTQELIKNAA